MSTAATTFGSAVWALPPLILHPFNERVPPSTLLENSKAALMLSGLIPSDGTCGEALKKRLMNGRYAELRMLYFLGRDIWRWIDQCADFAARVPELAGAGIAAQSFAALLTSNPPNPVRKKLLVWGVADYASIFSRAIGLNSIFGEPPPMAFLNEGFLCGYHLYADALFRCFMDSQPYCPINNENFPFDLYASGEYSKLLETQWNVGE